MDKYFLTNFPSPDELVREFPGNNFPDFREVNGHIHTPYSFSAFPDMDSIFSRAADEEIAVLGINDFFVADGYDSFCQGSVVNRIFPLFNIEFIGLMKEEQKKGIRVNDPNNPGRIYFCGKGLDYPFNPGFFNRLRLNSVKRESQNQIREMIAKLNQVVSRIDSNLLLSYDKIKRKYAMELVRERHLAKALRDSVSVNYPDKIDQVRVFDLLFDGKGCKSSPEDHAKLENEIRANLLKSGGRAFVPEDESTFLELDKIIGIILKAGGIPCYPVLLDDAGGNFTEFESDRQKLLESLVRLKTGCIELIPGRNDHRVLKEFVEFFYSKGFLVLFGTEHNTPEMIPLKVSPRGAGPLDDDLKRISWESVCVVAAHQYLRAQGRQGYVLSNGMPSAGQKKDLAKLGQTVIEYFVKNHK